MLSAAAGLLAAGAVRVGSERERQTARDMAIIAGAAVAVPLLLAVSHVLDVFDGRNVIATWVPLAVLVAAGLGAARAPRAGAIIGAGLCAVSLAVIVVTNVRPGYQRDDWRGVARSLPASSGPRLIVGTPSARRRCRSISGRCRRPRPPPLSTPAKSRSWRCARAAPATPRRGPSSRSFRPPGSACCG